MSSGDSSGAWFELRTKRGNSIIVKDDELPAASKGRIYLFNTVRDTMVEYDPTIVLPKLFELDEAQLTEAKSKYAKAFKEARKMLLKKHGKYAESVNETEQESADDDDTDESLDTELTADSIDDDEDVFDDDDED